MAARRPWIVARELKPADGDGLFPSRDSREVLEGMGFEILEERSLSYRVTPPKGWRKYKDGHWTTIKDSQRRKIIEQYRRIEPSEAEMFLRVNPSP